MGVIACRACGAPLPPPFVDLGHQPLANELRHTAEASLTQERFPLRARACDHCHLVQADDAVPPERLFGDYAYFSSYSDSWLAHVDAFAASAIETLDLGATSLVLEIASNDGYLLQSFIRRGVPVLGVEPAKNVADVAVEAGVPTVVDFFGQELARRLVAEGTRPDLVVANNVVAHVPDINDFVQGIGRLLGRHGVASLEFPHLGRMLEAVAFDTIYHEHHSYLSLLALDAVLRRAGLEAVDVTELATHGGSLRVLVAPSGARTPTPEVDRIRTAERAGGLHTPEPYDRFADAVRRTLDGLRRFLDDATAAGDEVLGYGAAAKGTVLLNAVGATAADVGAVADRSPHKVGRFVPGTGIPIVDPEHLRTARPRHVLVLPWNLVDEIAGQLDPGSWGGRLVTAVPSIRFHG